jgi:molybdopterin converting factor small subunit
MKTESTQTSVRIPAPLRSYTQGASTVNVEGRSVGDALDDLARKYPALRRHLFDEKGWLQNFVNIYLNDEDIRYLERLATEVGAEDELSIVPSIAGGSTGGR